MLYPCIYSCSNQILLPEARVWCSIPSNVSTSCTAASILRLIAACHPCRQPLHPSESASDWTEQIPSSKPGPSGRGSRVTAHHMGMAPSLRSRLCCVERLRILCNRSATEHWTLRWRRARLPSDPKDGPPNPVEPAPSFVELPQAAALYIVSGCSKLCTKLTCCIKLVAALGGTRLFCTHLVSASRSHERQYIAQQAHGTVQICFLWNHQILSLSLCKQCQCRVNTHSKRV